MIKSLNGGAVSAEMELKDIWSALFDSIWCISFTGYPERRKFAESELERLHIKDSGIFSWRFTFPTIFDNLLYDVTKKEIKRNNCRSVSSMSCSLGHYGCIKAAYEMGHASTLVIEDDVRFLKDDNRIREYLSDIPDGADIVNFDVLPADRRHNETNFPEAVRTNSLNEHYFKYHYMFGGGCYALSRKAMKAVCVAYEQKLETADDYLSGKVKLGDALSYCASKESLCCQVTYRSSVNVRMFGDDALHGIYRKKHLDYSKYNIMEKDGYDYGDFILEERKG